MVKKRILLVVSILIPLVVGFIAAMLTKNAMKDFNQMKKPFLAPPAIAFPIAWTILYILMGIAIYKVITADYSSLTRLAALLVYIVQLVLNFSWSIVFFGFDQKVVAFVILMILWVLVMCMAFIYKNVSKLSFYLTIPYILWLTFAAYLNISIVILN